MGREMQPLYGERGWKQEGRGCRVYKCGPTYRRTFRHVPVGPDSRPAACGRLLLHGGPRPPRQHPGVRRHGGERRRGRPGGAASRRRPARRRLPAPRRATDGGRRRGERGRAAQHLGEARLAVPRRRRRPA